MAAANQINEEEPEKRDRVESDENVDFRPESGDGRDVVYHTCPVW